MVSLKDISVRCGVSVATVSKALNGHKDVSEATRERLMKAAKEMGYFPNSQARALKTNRTYNLGVMYLDEAGSGLTHEFFAKVLDSSLVVCVVLLALRDSLSYVLVASHYLHDISNDILVIGVDSAADPCTAPVVSLWA